MKKILFALSGLVAVLAIAAVAGRAYLRTALPDYDQAVQLAGLSGPVQVWRDRYGIPHVWAKTDQDLARTLGYLHAQDRLWQMELLRRVADGRLAEGMGPDSPRATPIGKDLLQSDRFLRALGMGRAAAEAVKTLEPEERQLLEAYADGVNAWLATHRGALPPELVALGITPEPWTPRDSLSVGKLMAFDLSEWLVGFEVQTSLDAFGPVLAAELMPDVPDWAVRTVPGIPVESGTSVPPPPPPSSPPSSPRQQGSLTPLPALPEAALALLDGASIARASNAWALAGSRTASGKPILANDMHLVLRAPAIWYLAALHGDRIDAAGMMLPGIPAIVAGHTKSVAWGFTHGMVDDVDLFIEQVDPTDPERYLTPEGPRPFEKRKEEIKVKGHPTVEEWVRGTRHGPVLSAAKPVGDRVLAVRWTGHDATNEIPTLVQMNRSRSVAELKEKLGGFLSPHLNLIYADAAGEIGYQLIGHIPVRASGDGVLPVPGADGRHDWVRFLTPEELPRATNPAQGYLFSSNNPQLRGESPFISKYYEEPFRGNRLAELLEGSKGVTAAQVAAQQLDVQDGLALRYRGRAVQAAKDAGEPAVAALLEGWDGRAVATQEAPAVFYAWMAALTLRIAGDEHEAKHRALYFPMGALRRVLERGDSPWVDDIRTPQRETLPELAALAMKDALASARGKKWGDLHLTKMEHGLGLSKLLDGALSLNIGPFPNDGAGHTVNVAEYKVTAPPFVSDFGPSQRHVVDLADPDGPGGGFILPTGQSGLPFSEHYKDQTPLWREGKLVPVPLDRSKAEALAVHRATFSP